MFGKKEQVIFHGGCLGCVSQEKNGLRRCMGCLYFRFDNNKPNLFIKVDRMRERRRQMEQEMQAQRDYVEGIRHGLESGNCLWSVFMIKFAVVCFAIFGVVQCF